MNNQTILIVPNWVTSAVHFLDRNWIPMVGIAVIALLSCIATEFAKHKWSVQYEDNKAKTIVRWMLLAVSMGFTALGSIIYFLQHNQLALQKIPYIGQNEVEVLGISWALYNFRLNKTFSSIRNKLANWSGTKVSDTTPVVTPTPEATPPTSEFSL